MSIAAPKRRTFIVLAVVVGAVLVLTAGYLVKRAISRPWVADPASSIETCSLVDRARLARELRNHGGLDDPVSLLDRRLLDSAGIAERCEYGFDDDAQTLPVLLLTVRRDSGWALEEFPGRRFDGVGVPAMLETGSDYTKLVLRAGDAEFVIAARTEPEGARARSGFAETVLRSVAKELVRRVPEGYRLAGTTADGYCSDVQLDPMADALGGKIVYSRSFPTSDSAVHCSYATESAGLIDVRLDADPLPSAVDDVRERELVHRASSEEEVRRGLGDHELQAIATGADSGLVTLDSHRSYGTADPGEQQLSSIAVEFLRRIAD